MNIRLINNTGVDIRGMIEEAVLAAVRTGNPLPEEVSDLFQLDVLEVDGSLCASLTFL